MSRSVHERLTQYDERQNHPAKMKLKLKLCFTGAVSSLQMLWPAARGEQVHHDQQQRSK
jgi:hypothetical protein